MQREDRSWSWVIVTSIDPISCCLFAHSPLCIKGAIQAACRPRALHLITWHANRCYGLIRALQPLPFASTITSAQRRRGGGGRWRGYGEREGGRGERRGNQILHDGLVLKKKQNRWKRCLWRGWRRQTEKGNKRRKDGRGIVICPVWSGKWPHCASWPCAVCLCPNRLIP